jgi:putative transposase
MPWGLTRYYGAGHLHFITGSCYHRHPWLGSGERRDLFLWVLEQMRQRYSFVVVGYVVMPEHFHLLISEPQDESPSTVIQAVKLGFVQRLPAGSSGGVDKSPTSRTEREKWGTPPIPRYIWQRRFYDFNVWTEHKRIEKLRYMHRNPVKRGLVEAPEHWAWSSFRSYAYGGSRSGSNQPVGRAENEGPDRVKEQPHFSHRTREMGHPALNRRGHLSWGLASLGRPFGFAQGRLPRRPSPHGHGAHEPSG